MKKVMLGILLFVLAIWYFRYDSSITNYNLGLQYMDGKGVLRDEFKALEFFEKSCDSGLGDGCNNVGVEYKNNGDYLKAFSYLEKACDKGSSKGCQNLASLYLDGLGMNQDLNKAIFYYKKGCDGNAAFSCHMVGYIYESENNFPIAKEYYKKACELDPQKLTLSCNKSREL